MLADHRDVRSDRTGVDDALDDVLQLVGSRLRERVAQTQVVDHDVQDADATDADEHTSGHNGNSATITHLPRCAPDDETPA